jgi:hypothetical protein
VNDRIAFTVPRRRTSRDTDLWFKIDDSLTEDDVTLVDGLPVTTVLRTVCDLLDQHIDASHIATIIREAVEAGQLRLDILADHITPHARRYRVRPLNGTALLEHLLEQIGLTIADLATRPRPGRRPSTDTVSTAAQYFDNLRHNMAADKMAPAVKAWNEQAMQLAVATAIAPATEELRASMRELSAPGAEELSNALAGLMLHGSAGEELRQQIARSAVAAGRPIVTPAQDDGSHDEPDPADD